MMRKGVLFAISVAGSMGIYRAGEYYVTKQEEQSMIIRKEVRAGTFGKEYYVTTQRQIPYDGPLQREYRVQSILGSTKEGWDGLEFFTMDQRITMGWKEPVLWIECNKKKDKKDKKEDS